MSAQADASARADADTNRCDATRDAVTYAMDAYLMEGVEAVEAWIGRSIKGGGLDSAATYTLGCALIHAAHLIAQAITKPGAGTREGAQL